MDQDLGELDPETKRIDSLLFGPCACMSDPASTLSSTLLSFGVASLLGVTSCAYPARLAARLDPIEALRHQQERAWRGLRDDCSHDGAASSVCRQHGDQLE